MKSIDLAVVSSDSRFLQRATDVARVFGFEYETFESVDVFFEKGEAFKGVTCIILDCGKIEKSNEAAGMTQVACQMAADSYIIIVMNSKLRPEDARIIKASGASLVMMENEFYASSKLEFVTSQVIRSAYIPVKNVDLVPGTEVDFPLFHLMPVNKKFLKVAKPGVIIREDFLQKYQDVGEFYLRRQDLAKWVEYSHGFEADDSQSLLRKCRLRFLQLNQSFLELALMISDQSSAASFALGKEMYGTCEAFATELLDSLTHVQNPWVVINSSAVGDFGSLERAPAIAAYAGLLSSLSKTGDPKEVMIGALLADVGYLELSPSTSAKIRENRVQDMHDEEKMEYSKHPIYSLNQCLSRKLPFSEAIKSMILQSHERADQKGFPNKINSDKIVEEAMLIRLCWELDNAAQIRLGEERRDINAVKNEIAGDYLSSMGSYSVGFMIKMQPIILKPDELEEKTLGKVRIH
ncbi:HD domain-containing phosphohydrolase [Bdellovibrio sp. HCB337]|uniref:HD domain-containing phosphohydrolase n=1 Tax=Bdellovibrio sp. HCB337 TaxID=3394358 RepID=UPI0039A495CB